MATRLIRGIHTSSFRVRSDLFKDVKGSLCRSVMHNSARLSRRLRNRFVSVGEIIQHCRKREFSQKGCLPSAGENVLRKIIVNYSVFIFFHLSLHGSKLLMLRQVSMLLCYYVLSPFTPYVC